MDLQTFRENFGHIANAPDGVKRLRELVLSLAMQGKLVPHDPKDQLVSDLLHNIEIEKKRLVIEKRIKAKSLLPQVKHEEVPYDPPNGWVWVRLGSLGNIFNGNSINAREKELKYRGVAGLPYIATKDVEYGLKNLNYSNGIFIPESEDKFKVAHQGAVLICAEGGSAGKKCGITDRDICFGNKLFANELYGGIPSKFILYQYLTPFFQSQFNDVMTGIIGGVSIAKFIELLIPLPPLPEQKRIVAKVDELMSLCDKLEGQQRERERRFPVLSSTLHARLADSPTSANLKAIFDETEIVSPDNLRKTILSFAVRGKLVPQAPILASAEEMLNRILEERRKLGLTNSTSVRAIKPEGELAFSIPESWRWQTLDDLLIFGPKNGYSPKAVEHETPVRSLTLSATTSGRFLEEHTKFIEENINPDSELWLCDGDILVQRGNTIEYVGVSAVYRGEPNRFIYPDLMMKLRISSELDVNFIHLCMSSESARDFLRSRASGTSGTMPKINQAALKSLPLPIPPAEEQQRIVAKVDQLMAIVNQLEELQNKKNKIAESFAQVVVTSITGMAIKGKGKMKAPKTELVTKLQLEGKPRSTEKSPLANLIAKHQGEITAKALWQQSGMEIDAFYQQLKTEMANGWISELEKGFMKEVEA
ncbi:MAG: restriction endonuclease subunit S [Proteobacteria bacterium]|nr:hypothetical protein [Desulfobulbaceae bacterium]MBU4152408.1 restriction endonuclease subunit S [Pseudomonadota bacterium]